MCLDLYVHWVSRSMHLTELKQSDWVISALIINEFENRYESTVGKMRSLRTSLIGRCVSSYFLLDHTAQPMNIYIFY